MRGFLKLSSGEVFEGKWQTETSFDEICGEVVFYTGMTGFQEVLTDPSYKDQIVVFTYPLIGNYGINEADFESEMPHVAGVIVYEANEDVFHYQAKYSLKQYLEKWDIPLLDQIDTRALVKKIRDHGSMPAIISKQEKSDSAIELKKNCKVKAVSTSEVKTVGSGEHHIVVVDFGFKHSIVSSLVNRDCKVTVVPYNTTFEKILSLKPDGILLSNGPGDPKDIPAELGKIKKLLYKFPTLGICLGHQLTALALGANTTKLAFGHRGANHPVCDLATNQVFMSSQNHSYVVDEDSLFGTGLSTRFYNLHDRSVEGLTHDSLPLRTVQFHPEANPGPSDSEYIFDEFIELVKANNGRVATYA
ncbi:carbamoyl phosphate synthase small subunit [Neobacillus sp. LXY-4]|uniref:carbamoyl phosphate synthase small subunit n=1 Tax=Neobacillus sp. LXY-4 TaxID=3379826 RepID=UPI003EE2D8E5